MANSCAPPLGTRRRFTPADTHHAKAASPMTPPALSPQGVLLAHQVHVAGHLRLGRRRDIAESRRRAGPGGPRSSRGPARESIRRGTIGHSTLTPRCLPTSVSRSTRCSSSTRHTAAQKTTARRSRAIRKKKARHRADALNARRAATRSDHESQGGDRTGWRAFYNGEGDNDRNPGRSSTARMCVIGPRLGPLPLT